VLEIGSSLREARRRRGIGLPEASAATMIRARYLEALEDERVDALPEGPYQRSFLREYAEYLGLDGDILVAEWMVRFPPPAPEPPAPPPRSAGVASVLASIEHRRAWALALAVVAVGIAVWQLAGSGSTKVDAPPTIAVSEPHAPRPAQPNSTAPSAHRATFTALALTAVKGPCWLIARLGSSAGPVVAQQMLQQGQTAKFGLKKPLWIRLGAPWNLAATLGRRTITAALPALTGNVLVTPSGITPA
jgi:cytoskeleton protein RodZ